LPSCAKLRFAVGLDASGPKAINKKAILHSAERKPLRTVTCKFEVGEVDQPNLCAIRDVVFFPIHPERPPEGATIRSPCGFSALCGKAAAQQ
jgi:hypothetical protein